MPENRSRTLPWSFGTMGTKILEEAHWRPEAKHFKSGEKVEGKKGR